MKSIITISTLLFVTASFMGIGNYIRYNDSLKQKGLYGAPEKEQENMGSYHDQEIGAIRQELAIPEHELQDEKNEVIIDPAKAERKVLRKANTDENSTQENRRSTKRKDHPEVLQSSKKPKEREINFRDFSRAPLDDEPEPVPTIAIEPEVTPEISPAITANNEEKE